jgi:hypothetical protein
MTKPATVRALSLDGTWETIGTDRAAGIWVEDLLPEYDEAGPSKCTFNVRRQSSRGWPDVGAFTPIDVEIAGQPAWVGRVSDTPARDGSDRVMSVQCEGPQFILDDDLFTRPYLHNKLGDWKDTRSLGGSDLTRFTVVGKVQTDRAITLGWGKGDTISTNNVVGVTLDLGAAYARACVVQYERTGGTPDTFLFCLGHNQTNGFAANDGFFSTPGLSGEPVSGIYTGQSAAPVRYVSVFMFYNGGGGVVSNDVLERITSIWVYADDAYRTGGLLASGVLLDGLGRATSGLSDDRSGIQATVTPIPNYNTGGPVTVRKAWGDVDAFHDWVKQIDVFRRAIYKPKPASPIFDIGDAWSPGEFNDASANSGEEIYNRALITGQTPDGAPLVAEVVPTTEQTSVVQPTQIANPRADVNTANWTVLIGTLTRDTSIFDVGPASFALTAAFPGSAAINSDVVSQPLVQSLQYRLRMRVRREALLNSLRVSVLGQDNAAGIATRSWNPSDLPLSAWTTIDIVFKAQAAATYQVQVSCTGGGPSPMLYIDSIEFSRMTPTLADRRGFARSKELPIGAPLPPDLIATNIIGDTWLRGHVTTPFKGTRTLVGDGSIRDIATGQNVGLHVLGLKTMEMIRFSEHIDPDTGGVGRDGRMTKVVYNHAEDSVEITIDNSRASFEALLARYGVAVGT